MAITKQMIDQTIADELTQLVTDGLIDFSTLVQIAPRIGGPVHDLIDSQEGLTGAPIRTFTKFKAGDMIENVKSKVSSPLWSDNLGTLNSFYTNSNASLDIVKGDSTIVGSKNLSIRFFILALI